MDSVGSHIYGLCSIIVYDFTDYHLKPHSEVIYFGEGLRVSFKVLRIPVSYAKGFTYKEYEYRVSVIVNDGERI